MPKRPLLVLLTVLLAACTTELPNAAVGPFSTDPKAGGSVAVNNSDVTVNLTAANFKVVPAGEAANKHLFGEGHYHLFLDVPPTAPGEVVPQGVAGIYHTAVTPFAIHNVTTGHHTLFIELGFSDHLPYTHEKVTNASVTGALAKVEFDAGNGIVAEASPSPVAIPSPSAAASAAASPSSAASAPPSTGGTTVAVVGNPAPGAFSPDSITVKVGDTVKWDFQDEVSHTATADDGSFDSGTKSKGDNFTFKFDKAGSFGYSCTIHPSMKGSVTVQ
ncbi:MAG: cupredoxin domain-containing protein [Candidatus Dormibacteraeota bacterium]|nr:cupredoxin domain-containing protein [Candidatus Dormibacteraeota bacterium]